MFELVWPGLLKFDMSEIIIKLCNEYRQQTDKSLNYKHTAIRPTQCRNVNILAVERDYGNVYIIDMDTTAMSMNMFERTKPLYGL